MEILFSADGVATPMLHGGELTLLQYTGLKDKNGKGIYEADVIAWNPTPASLKGLMNGLVDDLGTEKRIRYWALIDRKCEVISNIYENPELLTDQKLSS